MYYISFLMYQRRKPKTERPVSNKVVAIPVITFFGILLFAIIIVTPYGLVLFNLLLGRPVYGVVMTYDLTPYYYSGQVLVKVNFIFNLTISNQPIDTILYHRASIEVVGQNTQLDVNPLNFQFNIPTHIYTGQPQNQISLYDYTFTFNDNKLRRITVYLLDFDASVRKEVFVDIQGSYTINGQTLSYQTGAVLKVDI